MKTRGEIEQAWIGYAREVVEDAAHISACAARGGSPEHPGVDDVDLRWPGYLGAAYESGGVLCVANVHRDFGSGGFGAAGATELIEATRAWRDGYLGDADYLRANRHAYSVGLTKWTVGSRVGAALGGLGAPIDSIAYTNAARCQFPELPPAVPRPGATKRALVKLCVRRFPIGDLVRRLDAAVVLFTSVDAYDASVPDIDPRVATVCFHQWYGNLTRPLRVGDAVLEPRTPLGEWVHTLAASLT